MVTAFIILHFTAKLRAALDTSLSLFALGAIGFVSGENVVQPAGVAQSIWGIYTLLPTFRSLIAY